MGSNWADGRRLHPLQWAAIVPVAIGMALLFLSTSALMRKGLPSPKAGVALAIMYALCAGSAVGLWRWGAWMRRRPQRQHQTKARPAVTPLATGPLHGLQWAAIGIVLVGVLYAMLDIVRAAMRPPQEPGMAGFWATWVVGVAATSATLWWFGNRARRRRPASIVSPAPPPSRTVFGLAMGSLVLAVAYVVGSAFRLEPPSWTWAWLWLPWFMAFYGAVAGGIVGASRLNRGSRHMRSWATAACGAVAALIQMATFMVGFAVGSQSGP